jgi:hypothetical protein
MVCGVSAKAIWRGLMDPAYKCELNEWMNESTPWFSKFVNKWVRALTLRHDELFEQAKNTFDQISFIAKEDVRLYDKLWTRKDWALRFQAEGNQEVKSILFAMLDGKDPHEYIWKLVKPMIHGSHPMVDATL